MPYATNDELPAGIREMYSETCQTAFRKAFNAASAEYGGDDHISFATAHKTAQECMAKRAHEDRAMMAMPTDAAAMRRHLEASPPDGHGMTDMPADMAAQHDRMHSADTPPSGHSHGSRAARPGMFDRAMPVQTEMEFRAAPNGEWDFRGYAALFDTPSDASWLPWVETIDQAAFNRSLRAKTNHTFVLNHDDNLLLASTRTDRLHLTADSTGLLTEARLPNTSYAADARALHEAGETRGMSFTFKPAKNGETWGTNAEGRATRHLSDIGLGHVTLVTTLEPGYSATQRTVQFRALATELNAEADDLDELFDALREGRALDENAIGLLDRLAAHYHMPTEQPPEVPVATDWKQRLMDKGIAV